MQRGMEERITRKPMAGQIIEALSNIQQLEEQPDQQFLFDPSAFVKSNAELFIDDYEMEEEELQSWCARGTTIRRDIDSRVEEIRAMHADSESVNRTYG